MKRLVPILTASAALAVPAVAVTAAAAIAKTPPRAALTSYACTQALNPVNRTIKVESVMRPMSGTRSMALKFELLQTLAGQPTRSVTGAGDFGMWVTPPARTPPLGQRARDVWKREKSVYDLAASATYRLRVSFRWVGARGRVLSTAVRTTSRCRIRELRPDLLVSAVAVEPIAGHPHHEHYTATITNRGATGAGPFQVLFTPGDGSAPDTITIAHLAADAHVTRTFTGPVCDTASPPTVVADSASQVDDYDRDNNAFTATCPAASTPVGAARRR
jgi:hypothetical protein